jgi:hypothetical protein
MNASLCPTSAPSTDFPCMMYNCWAPGRPNSRECSPHHRTSNAVEHQLGGPGASQAAAPIVLQRPLGLRPDLDRNWSGCLRHKRRSFVNPNFGAKSGSLNWRDLLAAYHKIYPALVAAPRRQSRSAHADGGTLIAAAGAVVGAINASLPSRTPPETAERPRQC